MKKILITPRGYAKYGLKYKKKLEKMDFCVEWNDTGLPYTREKFVESAKESTVIIVGVEQLDRNLLLQCHNLRLIVKFGVGIDNIDMDTCKELGILVERCIGTNSNAVAEMTIAMMFVAARNIFSNVKDVKNREWIKPTGFELTGKKIGILGFGNIGKKVAQKAYGLGMKVYVYDVFHIEENILNQYEAMQTSITQILENCDFITIHTPLTVYTENMISDNEFDIMKENAILINAARGGIVDEKAMYNALKSGKIAMACSDVFTSEPPSEESWVDELLSFDNFLLTAHIGSRTQEAEINTIVMSTNKILEFFNN